MSRGRRAWLAWAPAAVWAAFIFLASAQPSLPSPGGVGDKQAHAVTYAVLAVLCLHGVLAGQWRRAGLRSAVAALAIAVAYGVSDEFHQAFVPGRTPDVLDLIADAAGALLGLGAVWLSAILLRRRLEAPRP